MLAVYLSAVEESIPKKDKFLWVYENYRGHMLDFAYAVCRDRFLCEDAVHETFLRLTKYIDKIDENDYEGNLGLLHIMTKHTTINMYKKNSRVETWDTDDMNLVDVECNVEEEIIEKEIDRQLLDILYKLPQKTRDVLWMYYIKKFNTREIAEITDQKVDSIKKRLIRGRDELRFHLRGKNNEQK